MSTFSISQQITLSITPALTGLLSTVGSSFIVYAILSDRRNKLSKTYHRLLLGLSLSDIQNSIRASMSGFLMPSDTLGVWGAVGNRQTCTALGFFAQLGTASALYSTGLAVYYFIRIRPRRAVDPLRWVEPLLHFVAISFPLATSFAGLFMDVYNPVEAGLGCWVSAFPTGCQNDESVDCIRGGNADFLIWVFAGFITVIGMITVSFCMVAVYVTVRKQLRVVESKYSAGNCRALGYNCYRLRQTRIQAALYIGTFFITYASTSIGRLMENNVENPQFFFVSFLAQLLYPLQGFFNFFIYMRPIYMELRRTHPTESRGWILRHVLDPRSAPRPASKDQGNNVDKSAQSDSQASSVHSPAAVDEAEFQCFSEEFETVELSQAEHSSPFGLGSSLSRSFRQK